MKDVVGKIIKAESKAQSEVELAAEKAEKIKKEADEKAAEIVKKASDDAKKESEALIDKYKKEAEIKRKKELESNQDLKIIDIPASKLKNLSEKIIKKYFLTGK